MADQDFAPGQITIDYQPGAGDAVSIELQAPGLHSPEHLVLILLTVVEKVTGIRSQFYLDLLKEVQRVAARQQEQEKKGIPGAVSSGEQLGRDDRLGGEPAARRKRAPARRPARGDDQPQ